MGPAHGLQTIPNVNPVINPGKNPPLNVGFMFKTALSLETKNSNFVAKAGITMVSPKKPRIITAKIRKIFGSILKALTRKEMLRVNSPNDNTIPSDNPRDLLWLTFLPAIEDDNTIGRSGQMQGAKIVTNPEIKAKRKSITII